MGFRCQKGKRYNIISIIAYLLFTYFLVFGRKYSQLKIQLNITDISNFEKRRQEINGKYKRVLKNYCFYTDKAVVLIHVKNFRHCVRFKGEFQNIENWNTLIVFHRYR